MSIKVIKFTETPDSHQAGIASVEFTTKITLPNAIEPKTFVFNVNYKIVAKKDNTGFFPAMASYRIAQEGPHNYIDAFELDSSSMRKEIETLVMESFKAYYSKSTPSALFSPQTNPNQLYGRRPDISLDNSTQVKSDGGVVESPLPF